MSRERALLGALLAAGLAARLAAAWSRPAALSGPEPLHDPLAWNLAQGRGYTHDGLRPYYYPPPLYPWLLSLAYRAAGRSPRAAALAQAALDALSPLAAFLLGRRLFGAAAGLWGAALTALYPAFWTHAARLGVEPLLTLLYLLFALALAEGLRGPGLAPWAAAGLALAAAGLTRSHTAVLPILLLPVLRRARVRGRAAALFLAASLLPLVPWAVRNSLRQGRPAWLSTGLGINLFLGSRFEWEGSVPRPSSYDRAAFAEAWGTPHEYFLPENDARLTRAALRDIAAEPLRFSLLGLRKPFYLWVGSRVFLLGEGPVLAALREDSAARGRPAALFGLAKRLFLLPALLLLALAGAWRRRAELEAWWPLLVLPAFATAVHMVLVVECGRYHVPLLPFVFVLAGAALSGSRRGAAR